MSRAIALMSLFVVLPPVQAEVIQKRHPSAPAGALGYGANSGCGLLGPVPDFMG